MMKLYAEPGETRAYSYSTAYFKAITKNGKTVRVKYSKAEYVFHLDKRMFTSKERNALDVFFKSHAGMNAFRYLLREHNKVASVLGYKLPLNMMMPDYSKLPVEKG